MLNQHFLLPARWSWATIALAGLLLAGRPGHAQITNTAGTILSNTGILSTTGTFQNAGTFVPAAGMLIVNNGDFLNSGTITSAANTGTVQLIDASAAHTLALAGQSLPSLTLNVPAGTTLSSGGGITTALTLTAGLLNTTNANILTLAPAAVVNGETNLAYVIGRLAQSEALSGNSVVNYGQMGFTVNPAGQSYPLAVERRAGLKMAAVSFDQNPNSTSKSIDRIWAVSGTGSATPATIVLSWLSTNDNGLTFAGTNAQVWRSDNNGTNWVKQNGTADGTTRSMTITTNYLTSSLYTVSTTASPLPVELLSFRATNVADNGQLNWQTAAEKNAAFMEVQASTDGARWTVLGQVPAAGTSTNPLRYSFLDRNLSRYQAARIYYRLRLVDRDGAAAYSPLVSLVPDAAGLVFGLSAAPNPFAGPLAVQIRTPQAGDLSLVVLDAVGRVVLQRTISALGAGVQEVLLTDAGTLPTGSYTLVVWQGARRAALHLVRQ